MNVPAADSRVSIATAERHTVDYLADMYAVITTLEKLERANHRDLISGEQHAAMLPRLRDKFLSIESQLQASSGARYTTVEDFMLEYDMADGSAAAKARLQQWRQAATLAEEERQRAAAEQHAASASATQAAEAKSTAVNPRTVLESAQHFITIMDCLKLHQTAADQLHPILADLLAAVRQVYPDFEYLPKLEAWFARIDAMQASDQLDERATRDMLFDLERGYQAFYKYLDDIGGEQAP